jgi:hypothetical protein
MRCFKFRVSSMSNALDRRKGDLRFAHVWVNEKALDKAEAIARVLLTGQGWTIESVELSMAPSPQEIAALDPIQAAAHKRALSDGSYAYFTA